MTSLRLVSVGADCGWLSRISIWCQRHLTRTHTRARAPAVSAQIARDVTDGDDIKGRHHARATEWTSATSSKGLVWNIDVLWDLRGAAPEIYKLTPPVAMFTFCCGVARFFAQSRGRKQAEIRKKKEELNPREGRSRAAYYPQFGWFDLK